MEWFEAIIGAGVPSGPINTVDAGFAFAEGIGLEPVVDVGQGDASPAVRNPIRFSASPADSGSPAVAGRARGRDPRVALHRSVG